MDVKTFSRFFHTLFKYTSLFIINGRQTEKKENLTKP